MAVEPSGKATPWASAGAGTRGPTSASKAAPGSAAAAARAPPTSTGSVNRRHSRRTATQTPPPEMNPVGALFHVGHAWARRTRRDAVAHLPIPRRIRILAVRSGAGRRHRSVNSPPVSPAERAEFGLGPEPGRGIVCLVLGGASYGPSPMCPEEKAIGTAAEGRGRTAICEHSSCGSCSIRRRRSERVRGYPGRNQESVERWSIEVPTKCCASVLHSARAKAIFAAGLAQEGHSRLLAEAIIDRLGRRGFAEFGELLAGS